MHGASLFYTFHHVVVCIPLPIHLCMQHANVIHFVDLFAGFTCSDLRIISFPQSSFCTNLLKYINLLMVLYITVGDI